MVVRGPEGHRRVAQGLHVGRRRARFSSPASCASIAAVAASGKKNSAVYDESKIKTLSSLEHIRLRTGMYIGRLGDGSNPDDGIYILVKEVVDNAVDEFIMGAGSKVVVKIDPVDESWLFMSLDPSQPSDSW